MTSFNDIISICTFYTSSQKPSFNQLYHNYSTISSLVKPLDFGKSAVKRNRISSICISHYKTKKFLTVKQKVFQYETKSFTLKKIMKLFIN